MPSFPLALDKIDEAAFFYEQLAEHQHDSRFRYLLSAFLSAAFAATDSKKYAPLDECDVQALRAKQPTIVQTRRLRNDEVHRDPPDAKCYSMPLGPLVLDGSKGETWKCDAITAKRTSSTSWVTSQGVVRPRSGWFWLVENQAKPIVPFCREVLIEIRQFYAQLSATP